MMADGLWPGVSWVLGSSGLRKADECIAEVGDRLQRLGGSSAIWPCAEFEQQAPTWDSRIQRETGGAVSALRCTEWRPVRSGADRMTTELVRHAQMGVWRSPVQQRSRNDQRVCVWPGRMGCGGFRSIGRHLARTLTCPVLRRKRS